MGYIDKNLMEGERLIAKANLHWIVFLWPVVLVLIVLMFVISSGSGMLIILGLIFLLGLRFLQRCILLE